MDSVYVTWEVAKNGMLMLNLFDKTNKTLKNLDYYYDFDLKFIVYKYTDNIINKFLNILSVKSTQLRLSNEFSDKLIFNLHN